MILFDGENVYTKSTAVIKALYLRGGFWQISSILLIIPAFLRNLVYDWIARRRH
jgi:predicted DCC family thiol-disulfide oxidoreductase YuxK